MLTPTLIIDADPVVYQAGFASQNTTYEYVYEDSKGKLHQRLFSDGNKARDFFKRYPKLVVLDKEKRISPQPVSFARQAVRTIMNGIIKAACERLRTDRDTLNVETYLSGGDNFRYKIATITPYKANRPPPPVHYAVCRNQLTENYNAVVVTGVEADDVVSIRCRELARDNVPFVLATIDKDLDQVPGPHYDYRQHVFYDVDEESAKLMFWRQVLSGDSTDSIQGCYKIGAGKAKKYVLSAIENGFPDDGDMWVMAVDLFTDAIEKYPDKYPVGMTPEAAALETARLVKMQEYEGQLWNPPGVEDGDIGSL
jgi:hypothetical protein